MGVINARMMGSYGAAWTHKGYAGSGNVEHLLESLRGRPAIVAGNGRGVFEEVIHCPLGNPVVFAANDVAVFLPHLDHMVSLHTPKLENWAWLRRDDSSVGYGNKDFEIHDAGLYGKRTWHQWEGLTPTMALSGMFAAQIAYLMGCEPIVLCGCPNDDTPRFWEQTCTNRSYRETQESLISEMGYKPEFKKVLRSMSGWSKEFFGCL
jgi:hypothetical protein